MSAGSSASAGTAAEAVSTDKTQELVAEKQSALHTARVTALVAAGLLGVSILALLLYVVLGRRVPLRDSMSLALLVSIVSWILTALISDSGRVRVIGRRD